MPFLSEEPSLREAGVTASGHQSPLTSLTLEHVRHAPQRREHSLLHDHGSESSDDIKVGMACKVEGNWENIYKCIVYMPKVFKTFLT